MAFLVLDLAKLSIKSKACNILVLKCLDHVESNKVMIMTPRPIAKLRVGLAQCPSKGLLGMFLIFFLSFHVVLCYWFCRFWITL
jgi:hypothetical protein